MTRSTKKKNEPKKVSWEETCSKCVYGTNETRTNAKGKCFHKNPDTMFDVNQQCWVCFSFVRKWETKKDLRKART
jgi:uncharacterized UBP type Zn finger protein